MCDYNEQSAKAEHALVCAMRQHHFNEDEIANVHICDDGKLYILGATREEADDLLSRMRLHGLLVMHSMISLPELSMTATEIVAW
jgi:hypothetical protein